MEARSQQSNSNPRSNNSRGVHGGAVRRQGVYWALTIPEESFVPGPECLGDKLAYIKGQLEQGEETGYRHYQLLAVFKQKQSKRAVQQFFGGDWHVELTRSEAYDEYVWKEHTRIGERFEFGRKPVRRNVATDWDLVWQNAKKGAHEEIPANIRVLHFGNLCRIAAYYASPVGIVRTVDVFCGATGTGKSRRAWDEATFQAFPKDPLSKFWCGYQGHPNVVIDEFRGGVHVSHLLRWLDRYPVIVDIKGSSVCLKAEKIWITSNLHPRDWYRDIDAGTYAAILRRIRIFEFYPSGTVECTHDPEQEDSGLSVGPDLSTGELVG